MFQNNLLMAAASAAGAYAITNSCTFNGSDELMTRTWSASPTANDVWSFSIWLERDAAGVDGVFGPRIQSSRNGDISFKSTNKIDVYNDNASLTTNRTTSATFTSTSWQHIFVTFDIGEGSDAIELYIDGTEITSFSDDNNQGGTGYAMNHASTIFDLGTNRIAAFAGQLAEFIFIDGSVITLSDVYDSGLPVDPSGLTFGDDGCHLNFEDSSDMGKDVSGNGNDFTLTGIDSSNQSTNVPPQ